MPSKQEVPANPFEAVMHVMDEVVAVMKNLTASASAAAHSFDAAHEFASGITHRGMLIEHLLGHNRSGGGGGAFGMASGLGMSGGFGGGVANTYNRYGATNTWNQGDRYQDSFNQYRPWWGSGSGWEKPPAAWDGTGRAHPATGMSTEGIAGTAVSSIFNKAAGQVDTSLLTRLYSHLSGGEQMDEGAMERLIDQLKNAKIEKTVESRSSHQSASARESYGRSREVSRHTTYTEVDDEEEGEGRGRGEGPPRRPRPSSGGPSQGEEREPGAEEPPLMRPEDIPPFSRAAWNAAHPDQQVPLHPDPNAGRDPNWADTPEGRRELHSAQTRMQAARDAAQRRGPVHSTSEDDEAAGELEELRRRRAGEAPAPPTPATPADSPGGMVPLPGGGLGGVPPPPSAPGGGAAGGVPDGFEARTRLDDKESVSSRRTFDRTRGASASVSSTSQAAFTDEELEAFRQAHAQSQQHYKDRVSQRREMQGSDDDLRQKKRAEMEEKFRDAQARQTAGMMFGTNILRNFVHEMSQSVLGLLSFKKALNLAATAASASSPDAMATLGNSFKLLFAQFGKVMQPAILKLSKWLQDWVQNDQIEAEGRDSDTVKARSLLHGLRKEFLQDPNSSPQYRDYKKELEKQFLGDVFIKHPTVKGALDATLKDSDEILGMRHGATEREIARLEAEVLKNKKDKEKFSFTKGLGPAGLLLQGGEYTRLLGKDVQDRTDLGKAYRKLFDTEQKMVGLEDWAKGHGMTTKPFRLRMGQAADEGAQKDVYQMQLLHSFASHTQPAYTGVEEMYKHVQLKALQSDPLQMEIRKIQLDQLDEMLKGNNYLRDMAEKMGVLDPKEPPTRTRR